MQISLDARTACHVWAQVSTPQTFPKLTKVPEPSEMGRSLPLCRMIATVE
jgi:hypothetical protein